MSGSDPHFWMEPSIPEQSFRCLDPDEEIQLIPRHILSTRKNTIIRSGLSPNCCTAFVATRKRVSLIALGTPQCTPELIAEVSVSEIEDVVLSDQYLVVLTSTKIKDFNIFELELYEHDSLVLSHIQSLELDHEQWIPSCLAIRDADRQESRPRVLVGGNWQRLEIRLYKMRSYESPVTGSNRISRTLFNLPRRPSLTFQSRDIYGVKSVGFSQDGKSIVAVTDSSRVLVWHVIHTGTGDKTKGPISIFIREDACNGPGMSSASIFNSPEQRKLYAFCTIDRASGSFQRSIIAPVARSASKDQVNLARHSQHKIEFLSSPIIVGTVSEDGRYLATVGREGYIRVFRTLSYPTGGLVCKEIPMQKAVASKLCKQEAVSPTSLRFHQPEHSSFNDLRKLQLFAIDLKGRLVIRTYSIQ